MQRYFGNEKYKNFLSKNDIHHVKKVMRNKVGDKIEIVLNSVLYIMEIKKLEPFFLKKIQEKKLNTNKKIKVTLAQALLREQKWDLVLQKATELGVDQIIPLKLKHCNVKLDNKKIVKKYDRWNLILKEASEQNKRNDIPFLFEKTNLEEIDYNCFDLKIFCSTKKQEEHLKKVLQATKKYDSILIVVGPEGGFSSQEEKQMLQKGFKPVSLGKTILRTETASFFTLSAIKYEYRSE